MAELASIIVGALRAVPWLRDIFRPEVDGGWHFETRIESSQYNPYKGLRLQFKAQLIQDASGGIRGSVEKCVELRADGTTHKFPPAARPTSEIQGALKWHLGWRLVIYSLDGGHLRQSRSTQLLRFDRSKNEWNGSFSTTAADSTGAVRWKRDAFLNV